MFEFVLFAVIAAFVIYLIYRLWVRLRLSRAKHPSLRGHSKWSRRLARLVPYFEYDEQHYFCSDGAPKDIAQTRREAFLGLSQTLKEKSPQTLEFSESLQDSISDVRFTNAYRVPFPFRKFFQRHFSLGSVLQKSSGVQVQDLDGNWSYDLTGSYGVNVFGYDFYKDCMEKGLQQMKELGPVLGSYHPLIKSNVERLRKISGLDEVSFHMSGTEAVMQAVRLARYHTGRSHLVRLCGAYHGWWDGVQPGVGNQRVTNDVYTLSDLSEQTLKVLETRKDIACVLINPLQGLHPNADASSDASLVNSSRAAQFDRRRYTDWLKQIRDVCTRKGIVLIFDEVFTGFRLGYRGAQEYYGIQADLVTYGKTLGGGLPVGVVCGRHDLMKRFRDNQPVNISFARGTFNSHPMVMATMHEFLERIQDESIQQQYQQADDLWNQRASQLNQRLRDQGLPVQVANLQSIWTILYSKPSRYNWMLQFYLRKHGLALSWVGSGRLIFSFNYTDDAFNQVVDRFVAAASEMQLDGWWWQSQHLTDQSIKKQMTRDMLKARFPWLSGLLGSTATETCESDTQQTNTLETSRS